MELINTEFEIPQKNFKCLSKKNCKQVVQTFGQKFNIFAKRIKPQDHAESKPFMDFRCEVHFDVQVNLFSCDILIFKKKVHETK